MTEATFRQVEKLSRVLTPGPGGGPGAGAGAVRARDYHAAEEVTTRGVVAGHRVITSII